MLTSSQNETLPEVDIIKRFLESFVSSIVVSSKACGQDKEWTRINEIEWEYAQKIFRTLTEVFYYKKEN